MTIKSSYSVSWFFLLIILPANMLFANIRAPWMIDRYPSYALSNANTNLTVQSEHLEFDCDSVFEGNADYAKMIEKYCKVKAIYTIRSKSSLNSSLEFVLPSDKNVSITVNETTLAQVTPILLQIGDSEKQNYRLSDLCRFCKSTANLYSAPFQTKFEVGVNTIRIEYEQPLAITEVKYGYFQSSKWQQSFSYELWPLKEWQLDENFEMKILFTTEVGGFWNRLFSKQIVSSCNGHDLRFTKYPYPPFKNQIRENGKADYNEYAQNLNPNYLFTDMENTYFENSKMVYEIKLSKIFPDRLICFFGHER